MFEAGEWLEIENGQDYFYRICSGAGELFIRNNDGSGKEKFFLLEVGPGFVFRSFSGKENLSLLLNITEELSWEKISASEMLSLPADAVKQLFRNVLRFSRYYSVPKGCTIAAAGRELSVTGGESLIAPQGEVFFLELDESTGLTNATQLLLPERVAVISSDMSVSFASAGNCRVYSFEEYLGKLSPELVLRILTSAIEGFERYAVKYFKERKQFFSERYKKRQEEKEQFERSFKQQMLGWVMQEEVAGIKSGQLPIITALQQIAAFMGMNRDRIKLPLNAKKDAKFDELLRQILDNTGLYARRIRLEEKWHISDIGPMLVLRNDEPYAVIPLTPKSYALIDYDDGSRIPVDDALAEEIADEAYVFFRKIPEGLDSISDWLSWALKLCWTHDYVIMLLSCVLVGLLPLVVPFITQTVFDDIIPSYDGQAHIMVVQVMLVTLCAQAVTTLVRDISVLRIKNHMRQAVEPALWIKLIDLPVSFFRRFTVGDLTSRMQGVSTVSSMFSSVVSDGIFNGLFGFFNLLVMGYFSLKLTGIACLVWFVYLLLSVFFVRRLKDAQQNHLELQGTVSGKLVQIISGLSVFKLQNAEERAMDLWADEFGKSWHWNQKQRWQSNYISVLNQVEPLILNGLIFYFAIMFIEEGRTSGAAVLSQADFLSFNSAMGSFGVAISGFINGYMGLMGLLPIMERLRPVIQEKNETRESNVQAPELSGAIGINNVSFQYQPDLPMVLRDINLKINPGSFVAIVGSSGSGKSTLLRLILGLESPTRGMVEYDGFDISQIDINSLRRQLGVVMQGGKLMAGSIVSNIIGSLPLTIDDAWEAAENVGLADDIRQMPMGMHTMISEDGGNISGGQKQRILIARAIVNHARIIIFDEATSSLDNATQRTVAETMDRLRATRIAVAHRLSTIRNADRIIVLDQGRIVEEGNYDELMAMDGYFKALAARQIL